MFIDYADLKQRASMEAVVSYLNLDLKADNGQLRGHCPICKSSSNRAFVVTPSKGLFKCFANGCEAWGDQIALVAAVKKIETRDAALDLAKHFGVKHEAPKTETDDKLAGVAKYLQPEHESVQALGLTPDTCKELGAGYKPKGVLAGCLAIPIHSADGKLVAYVGYKKGQPLSTVKDFDLSEHLYGLDQKIEGRLHVTDDPVKAMVARQHGMSCVAFLGSISVPALAILSEWMQRQVTLSADIL